MKYTHRFFASTPKCLEDLAARELIKAGAAQVKETRAGVYFSGTIDVAYRMCLWSRIANRIFLPLAQFPIDTTDDLYEAAVKMDWNEHFTVTKTFAIDCTLVNSPITHSHFAALRLKDSITDYFRSKKGNRPSVDTRSPDVRIHLHIDKREAVISIDLSGDSLHRRSYRKGTVTATIKENIAAALLYRAGWIDIAADGGSFLDPMCGSGTIPIEAALIASDIAPGIFRETFGFLGWKNHSQPLWQDLLSEAEYRRETGLKNCPKIVGFDADSEAVRAAEINTKAAGLRDTVRIEQRKLSGIKPVNGGKPGLIVCNPPYGERLGHPVELVTLYKELGQVLIRNFLDWNASVLTSSTELAKQIPLRASRYHTVYNGAIQCRLFHFQITPDRQFHGSSAGVQSPVKIASALPMESLDPGIEMFRNRMRKNLKRIGKWARRTHVTCYRVYDADLPEFAVAIDIYESKWAHIQEYAAPKTIDPAKAALRLNSIIRVLPDLLEIPPSHLFVKQRRIQKRFDRYSRLDSTKTTFQVNEGGYRFLVNFTDRLDTGLFFDHRIVRKIIKEQSNGCTFLNLFCYTGTATVYSALGGAKRSVSIDQSRTYLEWAKQNMLINQIDMSRHKLIQADCVEWLESQSDMYDLIFLDPPTFSNRKGNTRVFDLQKDHAALIHLTMARLKDTGLLLFSNNLKNFKLDESAMEPFNIESITQQTISPDFARTPRVHKCWRISH
jgi:23S rRNA (guanine2069-N7)-methyltransferase / 23S rRNA (guanine2445-N2)-methyltransferase